MEYQINNLDVEILDNILQRIVKSGYELEIDIFEKVAHSVNDVIDYDFYFSILEDDNLIEEVIHITGGTDNIIGKRNRIDNFINRGGYKKVYEDQQKEIAHQNELKELTLNKLRWDSKLSKWQVKTFWWIFVLGVIGGLYSIYSILTQLLDKPIQ